MNCAKFWATFSQTHLVALMDELAKEETERTMQTLSVRPQPLATSRAATRRASKTPGQVAPAVTAILYESVHVGSRHNSQA
jgi:hypothetical protein